MARWSIVVEDRAPVPIIAGEIFMLELDDGKLGWSG
jgi:hypothetical protein